ncbi:MAG: hypothetical protein QM535_09615 [Limnohabitans sp.]|nr:hypothetical protein [Limnohabitans sp.]
MRIVVLVLVVFFTSCKKENFILKPGKTFLDIEQIDFNDLDIQEYYKDIDVYNVTSKNQDSLRLIEKNKWGSYKIKNFGMDSSPGEKDFSLKRNYPDYLYIEQSKEEDDFMTQKEIDENGWSKWKRCVDTVAYFKNIHFSYTDFITDTNKKVVGCVFQTKGVKDDNYYHNELKKLKKVLGEPKQSLDGRDNHPGVDISLAYDIWEINGKLYQFSRFNNSYGEIESIELLILNLDEVYTFSSFFNLRFTIYKDFESAHYYDRRDIEIFIGDRVVDDKDLERARKRRKQIDPNFGKVLVE